MKKIIVLASLLTLLITMSGCNIVKNKNSDKKEDITNIKGKSQETFTELMSMIEAGEEPKTVIGYIRENIESIDTDTADKLVDELIMNQASFLEEFNYKIFSDEFYNVLSNYNLDQLRDIEGIKEDDLKEFLENVKSSGYTITLDEGYYVEIDPRYSLDQFGHYLSEEMKEYLSIMAMETYGHYATDGGLAISKNELVERIVKLEKYLYEYKNSIHNIEVNYLHDLYVRSYVGGLDNTPVFNYYEEETNPKIFDEYKEDYERVINDYQDSNLADLLYNYMKVLEKNEYRRTEEVENFIIESTNLGY